MIDHEAILYWRTQFQAGYGQVMEAVGASAIEARTEAHVMQTALIMAAATLAASCVTAVSQSPEHKAEGMEHFIHIFRDMCGETDEAARGRTLQ